MHLSVRERSRTGRLGARHVVAEDRRFTLAHVRDRVERAGPASSESPLIDRLPLTRIAVAPCLSLGPQCLRLMSLGKLLLSCEPLGRVRARRLEMNLRGDQVVEWGRCRRGRKEVEDGVACRYRGGGIRCRTIRERRTVEGQQRQRSGSADGRIGVVSPEEPAEGPRILGLLLLRLSLSCRSARCSASPTPPKIERAAGGLVRRLSRRC